MATKRGRADTTPVLSVLASSLRIFGGICAPVVVTPVDMCGALRVLPKILVGIQVVADYRIQIRYQRHVLLSQLISVCSSVGFSGRISA